MTKYTYTKQFSAHYGRYTVIVPDQVAEDQCAFADADKTFPAKRQNGNTVRVRINAEATGLYTGGTGDLVVKSS